MLKVAYLPQVPLFESYFVNRRLMVGMSIFVMEPTNRQAGCIMLIWDDNWSLGIIANPYAFINPPSHTQHSLFVD